LRDQPEELKGVLFDLDGTLIDSRRAFETQLRDFFAMHGTSIPSRAKLRHLVTKSYSEIIAEIFGNADPKFLRDSMDWFNYSYRYYYMNRYTKPISGALECLRRLQSAGLKIGIASNTPRIVLDYFLKSNGLDQAGIDSVAGDEVNQKKPSPDLLLALLKKMGLRASQALYVGDMTVDVQSAKKASLAMVAVLTGLCNQEELMAERPDVMIASVANLCELLGHSRTRIQGELAFSRSALGPIQPHKEV